MKQRQKMVDLRDYVPAGKKWPGWLINLGERFLGFHALNTAHAHIEDDWEEGSQENFFKLACKYLNLQYDLEGLENIPKEGPCVIVANHPHGMSDGLMFGDIAMRVRDDIRIVVNEFLYCVRGMRPYEIIVDVYGGDKAKRANMLSMKQMLQWLREGHCLLVFPSGSAASYSSEDKRVIDDPWQTNIASIIRKTASTVVPLHISGRTGILFQLVTLLAKDKRASLLPREIKRDGRMRHSIRIGAPIAPSTFSMLKDDKALSDYLRLNTMLLRYQEEKKSAGSPAPRQMAPIDEPIAADKLAEEIAALPADTLCYKGAKSGLEVYAVTAEQIPLMMKEIGVQREITFRAVGEGSGLSCDLDSFDRHYVHLIMWDSVHHALAGAYRFGRSDQILDKMGVKGIYNSQFFKLSPKFCEFARNGLELGRAFITKPYQRHPASLDTLWMGLGRYLVTHPEYRYLYGTVSISNEYSRLSRALILSYLRSNKMHPDLQHEVQSLCPPDGLQLYSEDVRLLPTAMEEEKLLGPLVSKLESDGKSIPVLLRQYLRLGGQMLSFNIDHDFGDTLDCLVVVEPWKAGERICMRYMGTTQPQ
ncbi:MAG: lysophospholipid acyltransferase family protein [Akkermansia sp.]|nr:lysophospholipid acyltransferase family protein [Akkermansia sp.]